MGKGRRGECEERKSVYVMCFEKGCVRGGGKGIRGKGVCGSVDLGELYRIVLGRMPVCLFCALLTKGES